jgi:hypothetical protein
MSPQRRRRLARALLLVNALAFLMLAASLAWAKPHPSAAAGGSCWGSRLTAWDRETTPIWMARLHMLSGRLDGSMPTAPLVLSASRRTPEWAPISTVCE